MRHKKTAAIALMRDDAGLDQMLQRVNMLGFAVCGLCHYDSTVLLSS